MDADSPSQIVLCFDAQVYRLAAVKKAAYRFGDRCFAEILANVDGRIEVRLTPKSNTSALDLLEGEFRNEVLDQDLRESVAEETERVRNLLLAQAFSQVSLTDHAGESGDYRNDPLGIASSQVR